MKIERKRLSSLSDTVRDNSAQKFHLSDFSVDYRVSAVWVKLQILHPDVTNRNIMRYTVTASCQIDRFRSLEKHTNRFYLQIILKK